MLSRYQKICGIDVFKFPEILGVRCFHVPRKTGYVVFSRSQKIGVGGFFKFPENLGVCEESSPRQNGAQKTWAERVLFTCKEHLGSILHGEILLLPAKDRENHGSYSKYRLSRSERLFEMKIKKECNEKEADDNRIMITTILAYKACRTSGGCVAVGRGKILIHD
jgi:hypothetical protein